MSSLQGNGLNRRQHTIVDRLQQLGNAIAIPLALVMICVGCERDRFPKTPAPTPAPTENADTSPAPATSDLAELRQTGLVALESGDLEKADELAYQLIDAAPDDPQNIFLLCFVLAEQNRFAEAIKRLEDLAERVPNLQQAVSIQTVQWMVEQGRWIEAEQRCLEILNEVPGATQVHRTLVQLYTRQGRRENAASHLRYLARLGNIDEQELQGLIRTFYCFSYDPDEEEYEPIGELGKAHYEICAGEWESAALRLNKLPDRNAGESALLGRIIVQQQRYEFLAEWAAGVTDASKVLSDYWLAMGVYQAQQGDHVEAIKSFCVAVVRDHTDSQAYLWLSRSLNAIGAEAEAKEAALRVQVIDRTKVLAAELAGASSPDLQKIIELVDLLDDLQRPFEALSWRIVMLNRGSSKITEQQAQKMVVDISTQRRQLLQMTEPMPSRAFVLCGVNPQLLEAAANASPSTNEP